MISNLFKRIRNYSEEPSNLIEEDQLKKVKLKGYALIITCSQFPLGKWHPVPTEINNDHEYLEELLSNPLIGNIPEDNLISLLNPNLTEVRKAFHELEEICEEDGFIVIYLATQIVTVINGDKKNKQEKSYFAFKNTFWGKSQEILESSISMSEMINMINSINCRLKTLILNYALVSAPKKTFFTSSRQIYPSSDVIQQLADKCNCPVVGSCAIGFKITDYIKGHPGIQWIDKINEPSREGSLLLKPGEKVFESKLWSHLVSDWDCKLPPEITKTPRPLEPNPTWTQIGEAISIKLPTPEEKRSFAYRVAYWRTKRALAKPINLYKRGYIHHQKSNLCSPQEQSHMNEGRSIFGRAIVDALSGGASKVENKYVTLKDFFIFLYHYMQKDIERINLFLETEPAKAKTNDQDNQYEGSDSSVKQQSIDNNTVKKISQHPALYLPYGKIEFLNNPLWFKCAPPSPPQRPFIVNITSHEVTIEWYNPIFAGVQPFKYKIYMRNVTRNFHEWNEVYYPGDIKKTKFKIRDLPMGIACQFKVSSFNNGGWGQPSEETMYVTPGEDKTVVSDIVRWRRLQMSGVLGVLDRIKLCPIIAKEIYIGLKTLLGFGLCQTGFKSTKVALKISEELLRIINTFSHDPDILTLSFHVLGWCLHGKSERKVRHYLTQNNIEKYVQFSLEKYRYHSGIVNAIQWLRKSSLQKYIPPVGDFNYQLLCPKEEEPTSEEENDSDEDQEDGDSILN